MNPHSQMFQDQWVRATYNDKVGGTFLDIGAGDPFRFSNTAMLESELGWRGILCDNQTHEDLLKHRKSIVVSGDARDVDWYRTCETLLGTVKMDFLSLDLEPASATLATLSQISFDVMQFGLACVEHDYYRFGDSCRVSMRAIMIEYGYKAVAYDVGLDIRGKICSVEDWWAHPHLVDVAYARQTARQYLGRNNSIGVVQDQ